MTSPIRYSKVIDDENLIRDNSSKAILNSNTSQLSAYKNKREKQRRVDQIINDYQQLKDDIALIKSLLIRGGG